MPRFTSVSALLDHLGNLTGETSTWVYDNHPSPYVFRGLPATGYPLRSSFARLQKGPEFEYHLLRNFRRYYRNESNPQSDLPLWDLMSLAQHHGLPTRLLDWTFSPLVALHFATCNMDRAAEDGTLWCVNVDHVHFSLPWDLKHELDWVDSSLFSTRMLTNVMLNNTYEGDTRVSIKRQLEVIRELESVRSITDADTRRQDIREQRKWASGVFKPKNASEFGSSASASTDPHIADNAYAVFFEPPSIDPRIVNQYALFSFLSNPRRDFNVWLQQHFPGGLGAHSSHPAFEMHTIGHEMKSELRRFLDQANITERTMFPDQDGLAAWLKRHYGAP